jgi:FkbM family methyltransferase
MARTAASRQPKTQTWSSLLEQVKASRSDIFFLEVGAMDGVSYDPLHEHIVANSWRGMLIEPLPDMFQQLRHTYRQFPHLILENVAIADAAGTATMLRVSSDAVEKGLVPAWAKGISSFYADRNELGNAEYSSSILEQIRPHVIREVVKCETLNNLMVKHNVRKIDILQIDVEGHDYHVLKQFDFERFQPAAVRMEFCALPAQEQQLTRSLLEKHGYETLQLSDDLLAWRPAGIATRMMGKFRSSVRT